MLAAGVTPSFAQLVVTDIGPDNSTLDATNPNGASGGRVNGMAVHPANNTSFYAASEWGGLWMTTDAGRNWAPLAGHVPQATWDVEVHPTNAATVFATSYYDGRVNSVAGINVSTDGGTTWTRPATATPPAGFCTVPARRNEPSAFGVSIDPAVPNTVWIGTNCGLAVSTDSGATWRFIDPTPATGADDVFDVVAHNGGTIDVCGNDGHLRSVDGGANWASAAGFPRPAGGRCSLAISPDEPYVIFIVDGTTVRESNDGGTTWTNYGGLPGNQGRVPFVATNDRAGATFDLWSGDVNLFRAACTTPAPAAPGGGQRCPGMGTWTTETTGGHNDVGDIVFDSQVAVDACPILFTNDGGVYFETQGTSPACHTPNWEQPAVTPHALWLYDLEGAHQAGAAAEDLYIGQQDTGTFGAPDAPIANPAWTNFACCDVFDIAAETAQTVRTICCFNVPPNPPGTRFNQLTTRNTATGTQTGLAAANYPAGNIPTFNDVDMLANFGAGAYALITTNGVFATQNINAGTVAWTQLGTATTPPNPCGIQVATASGTPTFFVKSGGCIGNAVGGLWSYTGIGAGGTWQQILRDRVSNFGVYAVDPNDPNTIIASDLAGGGAAMVMTTDGGANWQPMPALDNLMTGGGTFALQTQRGPTRFQSFNGYNQPTMVAISPTDPNVMVAGAMDAGVFLSTDGGANWQLVTDPVTPFRSGTPHIPRPVKAYFDHEPTGTRVNLYVATVGRGVWRISLDQFGGTLAVVPVGWSFDFADNDHHVDRHSLRIVDDVFDASSATISWRTLVAYDDKNDDDDYAWEVNHAILAMADATFVSGESPTLSDDGGAASETRSATDSRLAGFSNATVVLRGWTFDYDDDDHHIDQMSLRLTGVTYDPTAGTVSWTANARYSDKNSDDDYTWSYQFLVIAFNDGGVTTVSSAGTDGGGSATHNGTVINAALQGFDDAVVLPQGWTFNYDDDDHHIDRTALFLRNVVYDPSSGTVSWNAGISYHDKNSDDDYAWDYDVAVLAFDDGGITEVALGPNDDDGGAAEQAATAEFRP
jgi:hypothetical protein